MGCPRSQRISLLRSAFRHLCSCCPELHREHTKPPGGSPPMLNMGQLVPLQLQNKPKHSPPMGFQPHLFYSKDEGSNSTAWVSMAEMFSSSSQGFPSPLFSPQSDAQALLGPTLPSSIALDSPLQAASQYQFDHYNSMRGRDPILAASFPSPCSSKERDICYQSARNSALLEHLVITVCPLKSF